MQLIARITGVQAEKSTSLLSLASLETCLRTAAAAVATETSFQ
jgi:hypothetical protein